MESGIRVELEIGGLACPLAAAVDDPASVSSVDWVHSTGDGGVVTEEVAIEGPAPVPSEDFERIYRSGEETVYRFSRDADAPCPCSVVERSGRPIRDVRFIGDGLVLTFYCQDVADVKEIVSTMRDDHDRVAVRRLTRSSDGSDGRDLVYVDRARLTDRQREVLETAHRMGYFEYPKGANAEEVADELGIAAPTFAEHLGAAQSKIMGNLLSE